MMLLARGVVGALLGLGLATVMGAPGQSPGGKTQQAKPAPELPPWDSAQPAPPIRPPSPEDSAPDPDAGPPIRLEDATPDATQDASGPVPPADSAPPAKPAQQPEATPPPPPALPQEAARPAPPADPAPEEEAATLPPSTDPAQRRMEKDTAELLRLSRELKAEVNKAGSNTLSVAAVQKADEIQRLVKSLKEQMKERGLIVVNKP